MQAQPVVVRNPEGCRRLLAAILKHAVQDAALAEEPPRGTWPWPGRHPQDELAAFWQSRWLERICEWLDLDPEAVRRWAAQNGNGHKRDAVQLSLWECTDGPTDERRTLPACEARP